jgi:putative FmdB family regulatory protein
MPIYAYKCAACGHAQDVLQKMSDDPLTVCPACGAAAYQKQVTAAGFQLKGSGWYVTDFRDNGSGKKKAEAAPAADAKPADAAATPAAAPAAAPAADSKAAAAPAPAAASGDSEPAASPAPTPPPASGSSS